MARVKLEPIKLWGWLSYPVWTAEAAYKKSQKLTFPKDSVEKSAPEIHVLLNQTQYEKALDQAEKFIRLAGENYSKQDTTTFSPDDVKKLIADIRGDVNDQQFVTPFKALNEDTVQAIPDAVVSMKLLGVQGTDLVQLGAVLSEDDILVPDPDMVVLPPYLPIEKTRHEMVAGNIVIVKPSFYAYHNGPRPGFSGSVQEVLWREEGLPILGSGGFTSDDMTLDD